MSPDSAPATRSTSITQATFQAAPQNSDLSRSGQTLELVGSSPFRILLGYAPGVRMAFNGDPVVLGPHTRNNVANLVLGQ